MTIVISLADALAEPVEEQRCSLCGLTIQTDVTVPWLQVFPETGRDYPALERPGTLSLAAQPAWRRSISGFVAGRERRLEIEARQDGLRMQVESLGEFFVSADGAQIRLVERAPQAGRDSVVECVLGVPVILSLALRGRWFLHASAVEIQGRVVAFAGRSGAGKSTIAAHLSREPGVKRVADDLLCYGAQGSMPVAMRGFPQLKLTPDQQPVGPPQPFAAVMLLVPAGGNRKGVRYLRGREKLLGFLNHGVAARAFPPPVLEKNMKCVAQLIENMDVIEVRYPRTQEALMALTRDVVALY